MTKYVFDTGFLIIIREYYPETFPSFWRKLDSMVKEERVSSVDEVVEEIKRYRGEQGHLLEWVKANRDIFTKPDFNEQTKVKEIFSIERFQHLVTKKKQMQGRAVADPFVIARAWVINGTVVTREPPAKDPAHPNMPDVCQHFNIPCLTPQLFMKEEDWKF